MANGREIEMVFCERGITAMVDKSSALYFIL